MEVIKGLENLSRQFPSAVVTLGNFDGVHKGHQTLLTKTIEVSKKENGTSVVYTFRPHPQMALNPQNASKLILTYDEKLEEISKFGIDVVIEEPFSREFSSLEPEDFFHLLLEKLRPIHLVIGYDFAFGKGRRGNIEMLSAICKSKSISFEIVPALKMNNEIVSSTRIRNELKAGNVERAKDLLAQFPYYRGLVQRGDKRGRGIGYPTANIIIEDKQAPKYGVYVSQVLLGDKVIQSISNFGTRPTFYGTDASPILETYILNETIDLYGYKIEVRLLHFIREEQEFESATELKNQISADIEIAKSWTIAQKS